MKQTRILCLFLAVLNGATVLACSCAGEPTKDVVPEIQQVIARKLGRAISLTGNDLTWIKAYPTLEDRYNLMDESGTSCEVFGPKGESLSFCARKQKREYMVQVENCNFVIYTKSTSKKVSAEILSGSCH